MIMKALRCFLSLVALGWRFSALAQTAPPQAIPPIIPPSPDAASLGKYGDAPVGMFTGTPNVTIGLTSLSTKHLSVPISLNYTTNGIKVSEVSSNVGMSWSLNCGGAIVRTVYGYTDFSPNVRFAVNPGNLVFSTPDAGTEAWMDAVLTGNQDTQPDAFNFNFNGYAGKFFIIPVGFPNSYTYKVVMAPYSNIKVQFDFTRTDWNFILTTPDGVMYYFGGNQATEQTENFNTCSITDRGVLPTAWYLTKIQHPYDPGDVITFTYITSNYQYTSGIHQTETYWDYTNTYNNVGIPCGTNPQGIYPTATGTTPMEQFCTSSPQTFPVYVQSITDNKYKQIVFDYIPKTDANGGYLLSHITTKNYQTGEKLSSFAFNYQTAAPSLIGSCTRAFNSDNSTTLPRPFLTEVDERDNTDAVIKPYTFAYYDYTGIPQRMSFAQDFWGYNNGVDNGNSFIPLPESQSALLVTSNLLANRNPDYNATLKGMLKMITYPTGGTTTLEYEGNTYSTTYSGANDPANQTSAYSNFTDMNVSNTSPDQTFTVSKQVTVNLNALVSCNCPTASGCPVEPNSFPWGQLIANLNTVVATFDFTAYNTRQDCSKASMQSVTLNPGVTYGLHIQGVTPYQLSIDMPSPDGTAVFQTTKTVPSTASLYYTAGGLRVKRVTTYDPVANNTSIKHYYYGGQPYVRFPAQPTYYHHQTHYEQVYGGGGCGPVNALDYAGFHQFSSSSYVDQYAASSSSVIYTQVTESFGDNFENGGIEHDFAYNPVIPIQEGIFGQFIFSATAPRLDWRSGMEVATRQFKMVGGNQMPVRTKTSVYTIDSRNSATYPFYTLERAGNAPVTLPPAILAPCYNAAQVNYISEWQYLSRDSTQDYDLNGNPTVAVVQNYYYDNPTHALLTRTQRTDSKNVPIVDIKRYPQDVASIDPGALAPGETTALGNLVTQGRIGEAIETEHDVNSQLAAKTHNRFSTLGNGMTLLQSVQQQNGPSPAYNTVTVDSYDGNGNILQQTPADGLSEQYIWDYMGTYPVAKIVNASPAEVAYTSFEAQDGGGWTFTVADIHYANGSLMGNNYYDLSYGPCSHSGLNPAKTYIVSYWSYNGSYNVSGSTSMVTGKTLPNQWTYYEHTVTGVSSVSVSGAGPIDEVRLYPANAQMSTYAYTPGVGIISQCDVNNRITYYFYDGLQRLNYIKDQDGNIVKTINYHYVGQ
jgi:hypothetical protein